jgi:adenylosuccinate synthase
MPLDVIVGAQWGDEGKGRITDLLSAEADIVARYSGGDNAGHTVTVGDQIFKLHLIPSGIINPRTNCLLGAGMVVNPSKLLEEIDRLTSLGIDVSPNRLKLSSAAHIVTPAHIALDGAEESSRGEKTIGTTRRGIGPAYTDKATRRGLRAGAMAHPEEFAGSVHTHMQLAGEVLEKIYDQEPPDPSKTASAYCEYAMRLHPYLADIGNLVALALEEGKSVLAEGAQGTLLDLDHGTYPFVTSSHPTTPGALLGLGVGPKYIRRIIGVTKAFQTRVGSGPFPTEVFDDTADKLRGTGENPWDEFGTTTGRPRRVGWLDGVLLRYAVRVNSFTELALTKLDILTDLNPLHLCIAYQYEKKLLTDLPDGPADLSPFVPEYEKLPVWHTDLQQARSWAELPPEAQTYVQRVESLANLNVQMVSVGPERDQVILRENDK